MKVVNVKYVKCDAYIGRPNKTHSSVYTIFGNPYTHLTGHTNAKFVVATRDEAIDKYREYFLDRLLTDEYFFNCFMCLVENLNIETLGCHCAPLRCHGDILAEMITLYRKEMKLEVKQNVE